jgi:ankyrin repeat protein
MKRDPLRAAVKAGDAAAVQTLLDGGAPVDEPDEHGLTPLMHAAGRPGNLPVVKLLLGRGADPRRRSVPGEYGAVTRYVMDFALRSGDPEIPRALLGAGADVRYELPEGYDALIAACLNGRSPRLLEMLALAVDNGAPLSGVSTYGESGLRLLLRQGRFDGIRFLLAAGSDESQLRWTPLMRAVGLGSLEDVRRAACGANLEAKDWWERTAWLLAVLTGDVAKSELLLSLGADRKALGRCGRSPFEDAVEGRSGAMLEHVLSLGLDLERRDDFGHTPLMEAAGSGEAWAVRRLLEAGADVGAVRDGDQSALSDAAGKEVVRLLLDAGADPDHLRDETRRELAGLPRERDDDLLDASKDEFERARSPRFGTANPEEADEPFWRAMIRAGSSAWGARQHFEGADGPSPVWSAQRFGQSLTSLPDGRIVLVAGEHEDHYDPDFHIYNDVFVFEPGGRIRVFLYPEDAFPPTDFHTATLVGESIYLIGSLGYHGRRDPARTPVYRLDTRTFAIEALSPSGTPPGWISRHRAVLHGPRLIRVSGGKRHVGDGKDGYPDNGGAWLLDLERMAWLPDGPAGRA